jgi:hypothetical protein
MSGHGIRCLALGVWIATLTEVVALGQANSDQARTLGTAGEGFISNLEAFEYFTCRWEVLEGKADSLAQAAAGGLRDVVRRDGTWIVDGTNAFFEMKCDKAVIRRALTDPKNKRDDLVFVPCSNNAYLTDGNYHLWHAPGAQTAHIVPPTGPRKPRVELTPLDLGLIAMNPGPNLGEMLRQCAKGKLQGRFEGVEAIEGIPTLSFALAQNGDYRQRYWLDPDRGFLPIRISFYRPGNATRTAEARVLEILRCSKGRWFPKHAVVAMNPDSPPAASYRVFKVLELELEKRPNAESFSLELPGGTQVNDAKTIGAYVNIANLRVVGLKELKSLHDEVQRSANRGQETIAPEPRPRDYATVKIVSVAAVPVVLLGVLAFMFRLRAKSATRYDKNVPR